MIRELLRGIGIGCLLAGGILLFITPEGESVNTEKHDDELKEVRAELEKVKKELAIAQTTSTTEQKDQPQTTETEQLDETEDEGTKQAGPIVKTILTIESGSTSTSVAKKLERAGIITDASVFEKYLDTKKLTGRIQIGEHEVDSTMGIEEIAKIITNT